MNNQRPLGRAKPSCSWVSRAFNMRQAIPSWKGSVM
uniref:Uncharacterized protein n=1 Tax=Pseudopestalotiopsis camelliae-sinensis polymycovirus 1 TaxID=3367397 RepID=A0AB74UHQ9_9VIRU